MGFYDLGKEQLMLKRSMAWMALGLMMVLLAGCQVVQKGDTVVRYDKGQ